MKRLLKLACDLKEEHPVMAPFPKESSLKDFNSRCESVFKEKDGNFKKKSMHSPAASGDDNDADVTGDHSENIPVPESGPNIEHLTQEAKNLVKDMW